MLSDGFPTGGVGGVSKTIKTPTCKITISLDRTDPLEDYCSTYGSIFWRRYTQPNLASLNAGYRLREVFTDLHGFCNTARENKNTLTPFKFASEPSLAKRV